MTRRTVAGCTAGCSLAVAAVVLFFMFGFRQQRAWNEFCTVFVESAVRGDLQQAYQRLHPNKQAAQPFDDFAAGWAAARARLGMVTSIGYAPGATLTADRNMCIAATLHGETATAELQVDFNPADNPKAVLDYRLSGLPETKPEAAAEGAEPAVESAAPAAPATAEPALPAGAAKQPAAATQPSEKDPQ